MAGAQIESDSESEGESDDLNVTFTMSDLKVCVIYLGYKDLGVRIDWLVRRQSSYFVIHLNISESSRIAGEIDRQIHPRERKTFYLTEVQLLQGTICKPI